MQRTAGKFAIFLAGIYLIVVFAQVVSTAMGDPIPLLGWPMLLVPAVLFTYSVIDAVKLHRTTDSALTNRLWRRSLILAVLGLGLVIAAVEIIYRMAPV